jgi:hypothetical protein
MQKLGQSILKVVPLYLERLPIRQVILHDLANAIWQAHTEKCKRNLRMPMNQAQLIEMMGYSCWILKNEHQHETQRSRRRAWNWDPPPFPCTTGVDTRLV